LAPLIEARGELRDDVPTVAILSRSWSTADEAAWALRQVAGAIACSADVHVITPQGRGPGRRADGVFTVHELSSAPETALEARRDVLVEAIIGAAEHRRLSPRAEPLELTALTHDDNLVMRAVRDLVTGELAACWDPATAVLTEIGPDLVVVADYRQAAALAALDRLPGDTPVVIVPLGTDTDAMLLRVFAPLFERSAAAVVFTESELRAIDSAYGKGLAHNVGLPISANQSVLREPNAHLAGRDYVLVVTGTREESPDRSAALARLLRARLAQQSIAVVATNSFATSVNGIAERPHPVERGADVLRLIAWARATVDLRPGRLFARRCLESLLYSTPIVVPEDSRAREHAEAGGGLWFEDPSELIECVDAMFDPRIRDVLGAQGRLYAETRYGSTDTFVQSVASAIGLDGASSREPSRAEI
jgi:hypothetical protein